MPEPGYSRLCRVQSLRFQVSVFRWQVSVNRRQKTEVRVQKTEGSLLISSHSRCSMSSEACKEALLEGTRETSKMWRIKYRPRRPRKCTLHSIEESCYISVSMITSTRTSRIYLMIPVIENRKPPDTRHLTPALQRNAI
jgi:hypothetical protein